MIDPVRGRADLRSVRIDALIVGTVVRIVGVDGRIVTVLSAGRPEKTRRVIVLNRVMLSVCLWISVLFLKSCALVL